MGPRDDMNWADKYKHSGHHTDRLVRTIVAYESKTGLKFPEPPPKHITNNCKMTWGKGGSTNVVQVTTKSRRAASVPAADVEYEPSVGSKTARAVFSAMNDANDLLLASKRQDQKLLNDIQIRMHKLEYDSVKPGRDVKVKTGFRRFIYGHKPALEKETIMERRKDELRYPWPSRDNIYRAPRKDKEARKPGAGGHEDTGSRREIGAAAADAAAVTAGGTNEEDHYPQHDPLGLYRPRQKRSPSTRPTSWDGGQSRELPKSTSALLARLRAKVQSFRSPDDETDDVDEFLERLSRPLPRSGPIDVYVPAADGDYEPAGGSVELDPDTARKFRSSRDDIDEFERLLETTFPPRPRRLAGTAAVRATPRRPYGYYDLDPEPKDDVVDQGDYKPVPLTSSFRASSEPRRFLPTASLAVRQAKNSLNRIERELGMGSVSIEDGPYIDEPIVRTTHIVPATAVRTGWVRNSPRVARRSSYNYNVTSSRPPPVPRSTRQHEIEARLETMLVPESVVYPVSLSTLRSRTTEARNKMDRHKVLLDRYLPVPTGPPNEVPFEVEYKFSELAERMPQLRPREPIYRASSLPPPASPLANRSSRPAISQYNDALRRTPFRPAMSETRKRAREVLCRTKGDPHYFDY